MQGMFRSNGGCGYMKKPDTLMKAGSDNKVFDLKAKLIGIAGVPADSIMKRTRTLASNDMPCIIYMFDEE
ncbi:hypothetical protein Syun_016813 [Stephania yunnanensis]|uniref:PI-PLC Y-box domain-containing protein n=1 Tax=Stephania yunnanensis TaxID=152371 RepID=A0AAP0J5M0_9MAGN